MSFLVGKTNSLPSEKKKTGLKKLLSPFTSSESQKSKSAGSKVDSKYEKPVSRETAFVASDGDYAESRPRNANSYLVRSPSHAYSDNETIYGIAKPNFNGNLRDLKTSANSNILQDWSEGNKNDRRCSISSSVSTTSDALSSPKVTGDRQFAPSIPPYSQYYTTRNQKHVSGRPPSQGKASAIPQPRSQQQIERDLHRNSSCNNNYDNYSEINDNATEREKTDSSEKDKPRGVKPEVPKNKPNLNALSSFKLDAAASEDSKKSVHLNPIYNNLSALESAHPVYSSTPSPDGSSFKNVNYFVRGSKQRSTTGSIASPHKYATHSKIPQHSPFIGEMKQSNVPPIFKRGTLLASPKDYEINNSIKKNVSFSPGNDGNVALEKMDLAYWPTKNGLKPNPPTRKSTISDSCDSVFLPNGSNVQAPNRPLPPVPMWNQSHPSKHPTQPVTENVKNLTNKWQSHSESESGSEAGEIQYILRDDKSYQILKEEDWADGKGTPNAEPSAGSTNGRTDEVKRGSRSARREDPRRHTLSGDHQNYPQQLSRSIDLEMSSKSQRRKAAVPRGYPPPSTAMMFDDDPGIMSEVETSSTGFRRGNKQRSSLPVVRTPSKTLERPLGSGIVVTGFRQMTRLRSGIPGTSYRPPPPSYHSQLYHGLVFLQYRSETKRALLPNEITSLDTVKALFVRSFPKQLTMKYLDSPLVKIYIHDSSKDMFYELEDLRSHLRDIRDRSVLRLFESEDVSGGVLPPGLSVAPPSWDQDQSYFSEPEFDSEYQHQHIHKTKGSKSSSGSHQPYYMTHSFPPGSATLPRGGSLLRAYSPALPKSSSDRLHGDPGYMSSPERGGAIPGRAYTGAYVPSAAAQYDDPYYAQFNSRTGSITPVIDEETSDTELMDESYNLYGVKIPTGPVPARSPFPPPAAVVPPYDATRIRVEHMERQLANLTGLVQKALTQQTPTPAPREFPPNPGTYRSASEEYDKHSSSSSTSGLPDDTYVRTDFKPPKLGKDKSVSFEKSVSFSDEPPDMNSPKQHSPQHGVDTKPTKSAIKSSTLPRMSSQERDRLKPAPPPKPVSISPGQYEGRNVYRDLQLTPEMYNQLRGFQKKVKDLKSEVRNLRRMSQAQAHSIRETIKDTNIKIRAMLVNDNVWTVGNDSERLRITREEDLYKQEVIHLETDLTELEGTVEELRGNVINRKTRVNMSDVENMALILSKSSKTVADLKVRFPDLQDAMKSLLAQEMDKIVSEEKFLKEEPERLESALRRCKKLTGTLVTLKRLASVQEQRLPDTKLSPTIDETPPTTPTSSKTTGTRHVVGPSSTGSCGGDTGRPENALDALLDELQTFSKQPPVQQQSVTTPASKSSTTTLRRLHSYPTSETKPPVPERNADLLNKRVPPPPPPRTSSRSPLASPTSTVCPSSVVTTITNTSAKMNASPVHCLKRNAPLRSSLKKTDSDVLPASNSSSCESVNSVNSQEGGGPLSKSRQEELEQRHQELLRKQKQLQEQYTRLQQLQRSGNSTSLTTPSSQVTPDLLQLKKTGSESNLLQKLNLNLTVPPNLSGSLSQLASTIQPVVNTTSVDTTVETTVTTTPSNLVSTQSTSSGNSSNSNTNNQTANKVYETDIL